MKNLAAALNEAGLDSRQCGCLRCIATTDLAERKIVRPPFMKYGTEETAMTASVGGMGRKYNLYLSGIRRYDPVEGITTVDLDKQVRETSTLPKSRTSAALVLEDIVSGHVYLRNINDYNPLDGSL